LRFNGDGYMRAGFRHGQERPGQADTGLEGRWAFWRKILEHPCMTGRLWRRPADGPRCWPTDFAEEGHPKVPS